MLTRMERIDAAAAQLFNNTESKTFFNELTEFSEDAAVCERVAGEFVKFQQGAALALIKHTGMDVIQAAIETQERALGAFFCLAFEMGRASERLEVAGLEAILNRLEE